MLLAQGRFWRSSARLGGGSITLELRRTALPEELQELRDLRVEVPFEKWNLVLKHVSSDRKLLGGLLLDFAKHKDRVGAAVASDRLYAELCRVILDATATAVELGLLAIVRAGQPGPEGE